MVNHGIPMRKDKKTYGKASNSYGKIGQLVVNHQIPMRKDKNTYIIEKIRKHMVNHQIPMGKDSKFNGKPSDSYEKRYENLYNTIRFL